MYYKLLSFYSINEFPNGMRN